MILLLAFILSFTAADVLAQGINCFRSGPSLLCNDGHGSKRNIQQLDKNYGIITDEKGRSQSYMTFGGESESYRQEQRRSEERRREMIYGDDSPRSSYGSSSGSRLTPGLWEK